jgi:hypothetical protein
MSYRILRFCSEALSSPDDVKKLKQILPESEYIAVFSEINGFSTHLTELANLANEASVDFDQKLIEFKK